MPVKQCNQRCSGCALTTGAEANLEPKNHLVALLAVLGPFPFYCHDEFDYVNQPSKMTRAEFRENGELKLCSGWMEEVRKLAATGYYKQNPVITKCYALVAMERLTDFLAAEDADEKAEAQAETRRLLVQLAAKRSKFTSEVPT